MKNLVIAFDLDGVLCDYCAAIAEYANIKEQFPTRYDFLEPGWFATTDEWLQAHLAVMKHCDSFKLQDATAPAAIQKLRNNGYTVVGLTARAPEYAEKTLDNLHRIGCDLDEVRFHGSTNKSGNDDCDYLLEDNPYVEHDDRPKVVLVRRPYNTGTSFPYVNNVAEFVDNILNNQY